MPPNSPAPTSEKVHQDEQVSTDLDLNDLDFTDMFKVQELKADAPPPPTGRVPEDILIGTQELTKGNCFINMSRHRPKREIDVTKTTILIVEDDQATQHLLHMVLSGSGYQTRCASDVAEFIVAMKKAPLPDLIILDIRLRGDVSGFKILTTIRSHLKLSSIPVIILSGQTEPADLMQAVSLGVDAYLSKPTKSKALIDSVQAALGG